MNKLFIALIGIITLGFSTFSHAATFDFLAEGNAKEFGYTSWDSDTDNNTAMPPGLTITASDGGITAYSAFFDGGINNSGGLGVCQTVKNGSSAGLACFGNSDDNQMQGEHIHMHFDGGPVNLDSLTISGDHEAVDSGVSMVYNVNGGADQLLDISINAMVVNTFMIGLMNVTNFDYHIIRHDSTGAPISGGQMYLLAMDVSPVPVPAAVWLFGTALFGFIAFSRRTKI